MKKLLNVLLVSTIVLAISSCEETEQCPAYNSTLLSTWFPYNEGQQYIFESKNGNTDTLVLGRLYTTDAHEATSRNAPINGKKDYCHIKGSISWLRANKGKTDQLSMELTDYVSDKQMAGYQYFALGFESINVTFDYEPDLKELEMESTEHYNLTVYDDVNLNNINYKDVRLIELIDDELATYSTIDKVYFAKGKGFIGYRTYPEQEEFWLK